MEAYILFKPDIIQSTLVQVEFQTQPHYRQDLSKLVWYKIMINRIMAQVHTLVGKRA